MLSVNIDLGTELFSSTSSEIFSSTFSDLLNILGSFSSMLLDKFSSSLLLIGSAKLIASFSATTSLSLSSLTICILGLFIDFKASKAIFSVSKSGLSSIGLISKTLDEIPLFLSSNDLC